MAELSPAALAVLNAYKEASDGRYIDGEWVQDHAGQVAAALRAAADQVVPDEDVDEADYDCLHSKWASGGKQETRRELLAIAAELEGHRA